MNQANLENARPRAGGDPIKSFPKAIIFDWDNTLIDSWPKLMVSINYVRAHYGLPTWTMPEIMKNCTRAARDSFPEWFGDRWQEAMDVYYSHFTKMEMAQPLKGAAELLLWLKANNIPAFVVSNKKSEYLRREAELLKWTAHFVAIAGSTDAPHDKPAREHVDHALKNSGITAGPDVWFVGDSEVDIQCALNSGCTPVVINNPELAKKHGITLSFPDCQGLQTLLYNRLNKVA